MRDAILKLDHEARRQLGHGFRDLESERAAVTAHRIALAPDLTEERGPRAASEVVDV